MNRHTLSVSLGLVLLTCLSARADELEMLTATLQRGAEALSAKPTQQTGAMLRLLSELQAAVSRGDLARVQSAAQQLRAIPSLPPELIAAAERLEREMPRLVEARRDSFVTEVDAAVERTRKACPAAASEADLTPLLRDLSALKSRQVDSGNSAIAARAVRKLESAIRCTEAWMNYLAATQSGQAARAADALRGIANDASAYPIVPLSEYEQRLGKPGHGPVVQQAGVAEILAKIKTLRDVEAVALEIAALPAASADTHSTRSAQNWFSSFHAATAAFLSGDIGNAWERSAPGVPSEGFPWTPQALRLRGLLLAELIPQYLRLPPGAQRQPGETYRDHMNRLLAEDRAHGRWEEMYRKASSTNGASVYGTNNLWVPVSFAVKDFMTAHRLEAAGDFAGAIPIYERVLRSTAELAPAEEAVERLKVLRQTQPAAFAEARPRVEADRALGFITQLQSSIRAINDRLDRTDAQRAAVQAATPRAPTATPQTNPAEVEKLVARIKDLETKLASATDQDARLQKLETLLGPGAEALARPMEAQNRFRVWLGPDFTVYRSALPPKLEQSLGWIVRFNGTQVLSRNAQNEYAYRYFQLRPGNYSVFLTLGSDAPVSNIIDFTISKEAAAKLPDVRDQDLDRDGVPNAVEGND